MKKTVILILVLMMTVMMTACNSTVRVYYQKRGVLLYYDFVVQLSKEDKAALEYSANKYNTGYADLEDYLVDFCGCFPDVLTYGGSSSQQDESTTYRVSMLTAISTEEGEPDPNFSQSVERGFFVNKVEVTQSNPLISYVDAYDNPQSQSLFYFLKNGVNDLPTGDVPGIEDAFPALKEASGDGLNLQFNMKNPIWYESSDGEDVVGYVRWSCVLGEEIAETITYSYYVPNSINWMITLAVVAVVLVVVLWLIFRKSKDTSALVDARAVKEKQLELTVRKLKDVTENTPPIEIEQDEQADEKADAREIDPFDDKPL